MFDFLRRHTLLMAALAAIATIVPSQAQAAGMLIAEGGLGGQLEIKEHTAHVTINNGVAVTEITQIFRNLENRQVEALYLCPVPKGASVANFSMWIAGKEMVGEVVEKQRAREIYNSYKQVRRDPGLLEQVDYKTFEMRIFPIAPLAEQKVQVTYYQELDFDHDWATYVYPLATAPRAGGPTNSETKGKFGLTLHVKSEVPIQKLVSPSHGEDFVVVRHGASYYEASLETSGGDLNRDFVLAYHVSRPHTGINVITSKQTGDDGYFQLTLTAGEELAGKSAGMDYVFVLDISGSMVHDGKLRISRESIEAFIRELGPEDRFEVITFNVAPTTLFNQLQSVTGEQQARAVEFLKSQQGRGGTKLRPAMATAYKYGELDRPLNVVILSDGMTEQSERQELLGLIRSRPANARVFCIGVGNDVNRPLLSQVAEDAGGLASFLSQGDDFARQAQAFRRKLLRPAAANVQIKFAGADVYDLEPKQLPNLYHGMPVRMYGRYRGNGPAKMLLTGEINGAALEQAAEIKLPPENADNPEIERMWAWWKVDRLLKEADRTSSRSGVIDEIVRLGEGYSIVTEYTSFLVLENDAEYQRWQISRRNLLRTTRDRQQQERVRNELARLREQALADLGPALTPAPLANNQPSPSAPPAATPALPASPVAPKFPAVDGTPSQGGGGGGGAFDPLTAGIAAMLAGLGFAASRKRREAKQCGAG